MSKYFHPLVKNPYSIDDINEAKKILDSRQITMSKVTKKFENFFSRKMNTKFSNMVNSGSSANLLAFQCLINPYRKNRLKPGDEVIIPTLCWSTSLWPIVQSNLKPVFVDINAESLNIDEDKIERKISKKTKAILLVHVLGNSCDMSKIERIKKKYNLIVIEDTCESLGSKYKNKFLGTFGDFSSFSFYTSHQISSGEGGMICCKKKEDYELIKSMRSHGWSRGTTFEEKYKPNNHLDKRFIFFNSGYNLRPTEISAAIGLNQFKRLNKLIKIRNHNRTKIINVINKNEQLRKNFVFYGASQNVSPSWFGLSIKVSRNLDKNNVINKLEKNGIETRPIISGNFANQPGAKKYKLAINEKFPKSDFVYKNSFFIGLPTSKINNQFLKRLKKLLKQQQIKIKIGLTGHNSEICRNFLNIYKNKYQFYNYQGNINNTKQIEKWLKRNNKINILINFAAIVSKEKCLKNKRLALKTNYKSVLNIAKLLNNKQFKEFKYLLLLSTSHVFSFTKKKLKENSKKKPTNFYGLTKLKMENEFKKKKFFFVVGIGRIFNYYINSKKKGYFINDVLKKMKLKQKGLIFKGVDTTRDYIHIKDICSALDHMITKKLKGDYNICSGKGLELKGIIKKINIKYKKNLNFIDTHQEGLIGDNSKLRNTGWKVLNKINYENIVKY